MQQTATENELSPQQAKALTALLEGKTVTDAAAAASVDRTTLHRWLRHDAQFIAAYNGRRRDIQEEMQTKLRQLASKPIETVEQSVVAGDSRSALAVLKGLGLLSGCLPTIGGDDSADVQTELTQAELFRGL